MKMKLPTLPPVDLGGLRVIQKDEDDEAKASSGSRPRFESISPPPQVTPKQWSRPAAAPRRASQRPQAPHGRRLRDASRPFGAGALGTTGPLPPLTAERAPPPAHSPSPLRHKRRAAP